MTGLTRRRFLRPRMDADGRGLGTRKRSNIISPQIMGAAHQLLLTVDQFTSVDEWRWGSFEELCRIVEQVEGVRFRELFEKLPKDAAESGDEALQKVLEMGQGDQGEMPEALRAGLEPILQAAAAGEDTAPMFIIGDGAALTSWHGHFWWGTMGQEADHRDERDDRNAG